MDFGQSCRRRLRSCFDEFEMLLIVINDILEFSRLEIRSSETHFSPLITLLYGGDQLAIASEGARYCTSESEQCNQHFL